MKNKKKKSPNIKLRVAVISFVGGIVMAGAAYIGSSGNLALAISQVIIVWGAGLWFYFGKGDLVETMRQTDERQQQIVGHAREYTAVIMSCVLLCGAIYEIVSGMVFGPFFALSVLTSLVFLLSFLILRARA